MAKAEKPDLQVSIEAGTLAATVLSKLAQPKAHAKAERLLVKSLTELLGEPYKAEPKKEAELEVPNAQ